MDKDILLKRLSDIEWDDFEVKEASAELPKNIWETVSAFSNTSGGWIILGIAQRGKTYEITGVGNPEKTDNPLHIGDMGVGHEDNKQMDALREGLINLLSHSDFFSPMKPRIRVFTNRIEFENPGALPRPIQELMKEDLSIPRNPVLAKLFRTAKLCENAGYGFDKMLVWKKETQREVLFETSIGKTKVTFMLKNGKLDISEEGQKNDITERMNDRKTDRKPNIESLIVEILKSNPFASRSEISEQIGHLSEGGVNYHIEKLKHNNIIKREGSDKGGKWVIISDKEGV